MLRRMSGDVGVAHGVEHLVAEIDVKKFVVVAHRLDQPRSIGVPVHAQQRFTLFPGTVGNFGENGVIAGQDSVLEFALLARQIAHPASRAVGGSTLCAISRVRSTSTMISSSGGM